MKLTLKALRVNEGLNQYQAAKAFGVSRSSIEAYEEGRNLPNIKVGLRICDVLGVDPHDIIFRSTPRKPRLNYVKGDSKHAE